MLLTHTFLFDSELYKYIKYKICKTKLIQPTVLLAVASWWLKFTTTVLFGAKLKFMGGTGILKRLNLMLLLLLRNSKLYLGQFSRYLFTLSIND